MDEMRRAVRLSNIRNTRACIEDARKACRRGLFIRSMAAKNGGMAAVRRWARFLGINKRELTFWLWCADAIGDGKRDVDPAKLHARRDEVEEVAMDWQTDFEQEVNAWENW